MAEFVANQMEELIPIIECLKKLDLLPDELGNIINKLYSLECNMKKINNNREDLMKNINYHMELLLSTNPRKGEQNSTRKILEQLIIKRVHKLYNVGTKSFPDDVSLWASYFKFCKKFKLFTEASVNIDRMISFHDRKEGMYLLGAKWEFVYCQNVDNARKHIFNGIRIHSKSRILYKEGFKIELEYTHQKRKECLNEREEIDTKNPILAGSLAEALFQSAVNVIHDIEFVVELINIATKYDFTKALQNKTVDHLIETYPKCELAWETIAKLQYLGLPRNKDDETNVKSLRDRIEECDIVLMDAIQTINTVKMHRSYLDVMLDIYAQEKAPESLNYLWKAFHIVHNAGFMEESYYLKWIELLDEFKRKDSLHEILNSSTEKLPESEKLWFLRLKVHLEHEDEQKAEQIFEKAIAMLGDRALSIWKLMIAYQQLGDSEKVDALYKRGIQQTPGISFVLRPRYLEWTLANRGIHHCRKLYVTMISQIPFCIDIHKKMLELEMLQATPLQSKPIRVCHKFCTTQFGSHNTEIWLDYIAFEYEHGDPKLIPDVYNSALKNLHSEYVNIFISEVLLYKAKMETKFPLRKLLTESQKRSMPGEIDLNKPSTSKPPLKKKLKTN